MAAVSPRLPSYRKHSTRDKAFVQINRQRIYLRGAFNSPESRENYGELLKTLVTAPTEKIIPQEKAPTGNAVDLATLAGAWLDELQQTGQQSEYQHAKGVVARLSQADAKCPAEEFGPRRLRETRERMVAEGWARSYVNDQVQRLRRMFRFGVENELVSETVWATLKAVAGLKKGRTTAPEPRDVTPAPLRSLAGALRFTTPTVGAMIRTQYRTGMRSYHLCAMRPMDIDFTSHEDVWVYTPKRHEKGNAKTLRITIGPRTQQILSNLLDRADDAFLFSPRDSCQQAGRKPGRHVRPAYDRSSYRQAVIRACDAADVPPFHPHQLRHSAGTNVRRVGGLEAAQAVLGHDRVDVTQIYAEKHLGLAVDIARRIG